MWMGWILLRDKDSQVWFLSITLHIIFWRRKRQPTPVFLPAKSHGQRSLVGYSPWGHMTWHDMTEQLHFHFLWNAKRTNQSILKEINPEHSLEGLMLKLKLQCFGHLMQRVNSLEKIESKRCWERLKEKGEGGWQWIRYAKSLWSCQTLCDPMDCSQPGSSLHGIP